MIKLTPRERQIVNLVADGTSGNEIAKELGIHRDSLKCHMHNIYDKTGMHSALELAVAVWKKRYSEKRCE